MGCRMFGYRGKIMAQSNELESELAHAIDEDGLWERFSWAARLFLLAVATLAKSIAVIQALKRRGVKIETGPLRPLTDPPSVAGGEETVPLVYVNIAENLGTGVGTWIGENLGPGNLPILSGSERLPLPPPEPTRDEDGNLVWS